MIQPRTSLSKFGSDSIHSSIRHLSRDKQFQIRAREPYLVFTCLLPAGKNLLALIFWSLRVLSKRRFAKPVGAATPPVCERRTSTLSIMLSTISGWVAHGNLTGQASRLYNFILQRSFFSFARMSCSEQSIFHGQASDRVWSFPNCSFTASRRKKDCWKTFSLTQF